MLSYMPRSVLLLVKQSEQTSELGDGDICDVGWRSGRVRPQVKEEGPASAVGKQEGGVTKVTYAAARADDVD